MSAPRRRPRHPASHWQSLIDRFATSDLSVADFCQQHKLARASFLRWRTRLAKPVQTLHSAPLFVELPHAPVVAAPCWRIELDLGDGLILRIAR
jgi:hypothetical protein